MSGTYATERAAAHHQGLPVAGYKPQSDAKVAVVNVNKELEERCLRQIDAIPRDGGAGYDHRMIALARTQLRGAFMWLNRAVFQPGRVPLPEDELRRDSQ